RGTTEVLPPLLPGFIKILLGSLLNQAGIKLHASFSGDSDLFNWFIILLIRLFIIEIIWADLSPRRHGLLARASAPRPAPGHSSDRPWSSPACSWPDRSCAASPG